jgi:hypothetical protein
VRKDLKAGRLWDVWIRQGLLSQDRPRSESPLRYWKRSDPQVTRQKRLNYMAAQVGTPSARRGMARRERRLRHIERLL